MTKVLFYTTELSYYSCHACDVSCAGTVRCILNLSSMPVRPFLEGCGCHCDIEGVVTCPLASLHVGLPLDAPPTMHMLKQCKLIHSRVGPSEGVRVPIGSLLIVMQAVRLGLATWLKGHEALLAGGGVHHWAEVLGGMVPHLLWGTGPHVLQVLLHVQCIHATHQSFSQNTVIHYNHHAHIS